MPTAPPPTHTLRPLAVVGVLGQADASALSSAPRAVQEGAFGSFTLLQPQAGGTVRLVVSILRVSMHVGVRHAGGSAWARITGKHWPCCATG